MGRIKMGQLTVAATQPPTFRGFFRIGGANLIVRDDPALFDDPNYAPGVFESLQEAWDNGDYFVVDQVDDDGNIVDSLGSMAGYGGPRKAAEAFARDHAVKTNPGRTSGRRREMRPYEIDSAMTGGTLSGEQLTRLAALLERRTGIACRAVLDSHNGAHNDDPDIISDDVFFAAAEAIASDHAVKTNPGRTSGQKRRWVTGGIIHRYTAKGFSREDTGGNCDAWARLGGRGEPHLLVTYVDEQSAPVLEHRPVTLSIMRAMTGNEEDILYSRDYASSDRFLRALGDLSNAEMVGTFDITG
jgi:hypothetical protein